MKAIATAAVVLLSLPGLWAHREGSGSQQVLGNHLAASSAAGVGAGVESAATVSLTALFEKLHNQLEQCQGMQAEESNEAGDARQSVKKVGDCVNAIAAFAEATKNQRDKSIQANKNYAEDLKLAKNILLYLTKQTNSHEQEFNKYRTNQEQHLHTVNEMLSQVQQDTGPLASDFWKSGNPGSLLSTDMSQMPQMLGGQPQMPQMLGGQAMPPQPPAAWNNMAAMFTPQGQNFGVPGGAPRRPSLLQLSPESPSMTASSLQARLDREAAKLEADELGVGADLDAQ